MLNTKIVTEKTKDKYAKFIELVPNKFTLLIVMQDNPNPDAIAAAVALRILIKHVTKARCSIAHGGTIGRGENRALVRYLNTTMHNCQEIDFAKFDFIVMVDAQPSTGNTSLPVGCLPDIVFDHHPLRNLTRRVKFRDIPP